MDSKHHNPGQTPTQGDAPDASERRRVGRIVHDHKGTARVQWQDAPDGQPRPVLEIEGARQPAKAAAPVGLGTGSLAIKTDESFDPYTRLPDAQNKGLPRKPTDLRKLSAWIKLMRALEEAKSRDGGGD